MTGVADGDLELLGILYDRYHARIYNFILKSTGERDLSQDVAQETFYKVLRYRSSYNGRSFTTWIHTIARNLCNDHFSHRDRHVVRLEPHHAGVEAPDVGVWVGEDRNPALAYALSQLDLTDRQLIIMSRYQGMKYAEIAEVVGTTTGAVKTRMYRAMQSLRTHYFNGETR